MSLSIRFAHRIFILTFIELPARQLPIRPPGRLSAQPCNKIISFTMFLAGVYQYLSMHNKKTVKLLTLNVFLRPPPIKTNEDDYKEERFLNIMKLVHEYDILCFEEMFQTGSFRTEKIIEYAIANKYYYWKMSESPGFTPGAVVDSGLLVLSKYPILYSYFESYDLGILSDSASDKGYIYCKIRIGDDILHLFVTHLQASYMVPGQDLERELSVKTRLHQTQMLLLRIEKHLNANGYKFKDLIMLVGDLNINSKQTPFRLTTSSHLKEGKRQTVGEKRKDLRVPLHEENQEQEHFQQFRAFQRQFAKKNYDLIDHMVEKDSSHPVTFGDNEYILTDHSQSQSFQRLDYIFTVRPSRGSDSAKLKADSSTCLVQQFKQPDQKYGQLSDHYGVSIEIK